jgi:iron complex transport system substrate-binding protein
MRICSFLPSATEILYALGLGDDLVGVTYACDFPPEARSKAVVVRTALGPTESPAELDRQVSDFVARGESLYRVDMEELERLAPDLILTQDLCHVCAASPDDLAEALSRLPREPRVLSLAPSTLSEVFADLRRVGEATGRVETAVQLVAQLERTVADVEQAVAGAEHRPRVLCLEWLDPPYVGGHWVPEMVARVGGRDVLGRPAEPSRRVTWKEVLASQPDVVVVMPCGYDLEETVAEFHRTELPAGWTQLPAVKAGRVYAVDATSYFSRPGPRLATGLRLLAALLHPTRGTTPPPSGSATCL